jgi:hypothetical protein
VSHPEVPAAPQQPAHAEAGYSASPPAAHLHQPPYFFAGTNNSGQLPPQPYYAAPQSSPLNKPPRKQLWVGLGAGFAAGVLVSVLAAGIGSAVQTVNASHALQKAADECGGADIDGVSVIDEGSSLTIDTEGEDDLSGASMEDTACILAALEVPESVIAQMDATTAMQGRQTAAWNNVEASWTYHPNTGVKIILTTAKN